MVISEGWAVRFGLFCMKKPTDNHLTGSPFWVQCVGASPPSLTPQAATRPVKDSLASDYAKVVKKIEFTKL